MKSIIKEPVKFLKDFLDRLVAFDKLCKDIDTQAADKIRKMKKDHDDEISRMEQGHNSELSRMNKEKEHISDVFLKVKNKKEHVESAVNNKEELFRKYEAKLKALTQSDEPRRRVIYEKMTQAKFSENAQEVERFRRELFANKEQLMQNRDKKWQEYQTQCAEIQRLLESQQEQKNIEITKMNDEIIKKNDEISKTKIRHNDEISKKKVELSTAFASFKTKAEFDRQERLKAEFVKFKTDINPEKIKEEYAKILAVEPSLENYECPKENPENVHIAELTYDLRKTDFDTHTISLLKNNYSLLYKNNELYLPYSLTFDSSFNYLFEVKLGDTKGRETLIDRACSLTMRLFMTIPPNKVNFTFIDPIDLGHNFAIFTQLVDVDDQRTTKVINGKIWT